ncbi:MAG TPA: glycosyltransferase [Patescibacteria group bacterium]|nr:glycosyltransferase [Patescibacteria group bacterium]
MRADISVIIPAHNAGRFLAEALDSVHAQGFGSFEVVVVDDGSTDDTADVARAYGRGVMVVRQPRSGSGRARNRGLEETSGELVAFLDADDAWDDAKWRLQQPVLSSRPAPGLIFSDLIAFEDGRRSDRTYFQQRGFDGRCNLSSIFLYDMIMTSTVIARRAAIDEVGRFDESLPIGQDTDLWFRLALRYPIAVVDQPLVRRRVHPGNITKNSRLLARCVVEIWSRYLDRCIEREPEMRRRLLEDFGRKRWSHLFEEGCSLLREGRPREARRRLGEAIGVSPFRPRPYAFWLASLLRASAGEEPR